MIPPGYGGSIEEKNWNPFDNSPIIQNISPSNDDNL